MIWTVGIYDISDTEQQNAITGRLTYKLWSTFHLGIAGSIRDLDGEKYRLKQRAEVHTADKIVKSSKISADKVNLLGLEVAWFKDSFLIQTEYILAAIKSKNEENVNYAGYYLQGSYFLTGNAYSYKDGRFGKPNVKSGAYELATRYSVLDAQDNDSGNKATNITFGINYYMNKQVRIMVNYIHTQLKEDGSDENGNAVSFRMQYIF